MQKNREVFDIVMQQFLAKVKNRPVFVCSCCERLLFESQALHCKKEKYKDQELANKCIRDTYLHTCTDDCEVPCVWIEIGRGQPWICSNCDKKLKRGVMPPECVQQLFGSRPHSPRIGLFEQHIAAFNCQQYTIYEDGGIAQRWAKWSSRTGDVCSSQYSPNYKFAPPLKDGRFHLANKVKA